MEFSELQKQVREEILKTRAGRLLRRNLPYKLLIVVKWLARALEALREASKQSVKLPPGKLIYEESIGSFQDEKLIKQCSLLILRFFWKRDQCVEVHYRYSTPDGDMVVSNYELVWASLFAPVTKNRSFRIWKWRETREVTSSPTDIYSTRNPADVSSKKFDVRLVV